MSRADGNRPPAGLVRALDLVAEEVPGPDVAEATWARGRSARRRRHAVVAGGMASALVAGTLGWAALSPQEGSPMLPAETPEATTTDETPTTENPDSGLAAVVTARAAALRDRLEVDCLRGKGWRVSVSTDTGLREIGPSRAMQLDTPAHAAIAAADDLADCARLYRFGPEVDQVPIGGTPDDDTQRVMETVYRHYAEAAECFRREEGLILTVPDEHAFVWEYGIAGAVPWHPYLGVVHAGRTVQEVHDQCPVRPWEEPG